MTQLVRVEDLVDTIQLPADVNPVAWLTAQGIPVYTDWAGAAAITTTDAARLRADQHPLREES